MEANTFCHVPMFLEPASPDDPVFTAGPEGYHLVSRGGKPLWEAPQSFSGSNGQDGWVRLPGGIMLQWGYQLNRGHNSFISFNQAFPRQCFNVSVTDVTNPAAPQGGTIHVMGVRKDSITNNGFTLWLRPLDVNPASPLYWFAIGV